MEAKQTVPHINVQETDEEEEDIDYDYYYYCFHGGHDDDHESSPHLNNNHDPEYFYFECLSRKDAEKFLQDIVDSAISVLKVRPALARQLLLQSKWSHQSDVLLKILSSREPNIDKSVTKKTCSSYLMCDVCANLNLLKKFSSLPCGHSFCQPCWEAYIAHQIERGSSISISCMSSECEELVSEDFVERHVRDCSLFQKYKTLSFQESVRLHPYLRFCPGQNCNVIIKVIKSEAKKCICSTCSKVFCFQCGGDYHAPSNCDTIKRWLTKCADDSETANYISAHTKDCPKCNICIEKNGGCNHMQCFNCKHDFCWMCLGDWRSHGSEYYECSRYKENPNIVHESAHAQAREALKKYLHYFERWENHAKSMKLEAQTTEKIKEKISKKVMEGCGTWIDWQYLLDASSLLAKCRYTLQFTYPFAYYMESSPRKDLFEYQQAQLEAEIENLSWKIEHAESTDRGDLENQIDIAEKRRSSLLKDFLP